MERRAEGHSHEDVTIRSDEAIDPVDIATTVYRPAGTTARDPVPMILHSHRWSGLRTASDRAFRTELDAGFGVLSFDQYGHGESGGQAHVQEPDREGRDVIAMLDYVARLDWVARSATDLPIPEEANPTVFAMGGSYGGAYQLVGAFTKTRDAGYTRFDTLAPQITWFGITESLAPKNVPRSTWLAALYAGSSMVPRYVHESFAYSATIGLWSNSDSVGELDLESKLSDNGPAGFFNEGVQIDVPVLFRQGLSDNLFNFNQAWKNFERGLTEKARASSAVIGYNGGNALPNAFPSGTISYVNPSGPTDDFGSARLPFFWHIDDGTGDARDVVEARYRFTTASGNRAVSVERVDDRTLIGGGVDLRVTGDGEGGLAIDSVSGGIAATTTGIGAPVHHPLAEGPLTVVGVPNLLATVTSENVYQRLFAALSVGESPATVRILQNNVIRLHEPEPVAGVERPVELPGVAVDIRERQKLFLTLSAASAMFPLHGSTRTPGAMLLEGLTVGVPLADD